MSRVVYDSVKGLVEYNDGNGFEVQGAVSLSGVVSGTKMKVITAGRVLTAADSGAVLIPEGGAQTFTLPAPEAGLNFKMYAGIDEPHKLQVNGGKIFGIAININNAQLEMAEGQAVYDKTAVAFGVAQQVGDFMEVVCNGTNWFLHAVTNDPLTLTP